MSSTRPAANSGALTNLNVGGGYVSLMQFDLSMLPAGTTASQITRAVLRVYCNRADTPGPVSLQPITSAWGEYSVTYATKPVTGSVVVVAQVAAADSYVAFDVTSTVQGWVTSPATNFGLALTANSAVVQFDSKENDQTGHAASLEVVLAAGGVAGPQGPAGSPGLTGPQGPAGPQGPTGAAGTAGVPGAQGLQGPQGTPGAAGVAGPAGSVGATGPAGPAGFQGPAGAAGAVGPAGLTGSAGPVGPMGPQGPAGANGATGSPGLVYQGTYSAATNYAPGDVAVFAGASYVSLVAANHGNTPGSSPYYWGMLTAQGPQGVQGPVGGAGPTGPQGLTGSTGPIGEKGDTGAQGPAGQAGAQGIAGSTGSQGLQGPMGPQGAAGPVGMNFRGTYDAAVNYAVGDGVSFGNVGYVSLVASNHGNTPGSSPNAWSVFATGTAGPAGGAGVAGAQGPVGPAGPTGPQGPAGATGATGATGQGLYPLGAYSPVNGYGVGDVVGYLGSGYVSLVANNHGQTPDVSPGYWALLAAKGDTGTAGATGATGAQGPAGAAGAQGAAGPQGVAGIQGSVGAQGPAGAQGLTGATGSKGDKGDVGTQGASGAAGAQGIPGSNGAAGPPGPAGAQGPAGAAGTQGVAGPAGAVGLNFRAGWVQGTRYAVNDAVTYGGSTYLAQSANQNVQPDTDQQAWQVIAQAGVAGPTGAAATVAVGTPVTLPAGSNATVQNVGTSTEAVLVFGIPQGNKGDKGDAGAGGGATVAESGNFAAMYHSVSYLTTYYSLNASTASLNETTAVLAWVPRGCSAVRLDVFSQQSNAVTVTVRKGTPGAMSDTALTCSPAANGGSCTATGAVAVGAGAFLDLSITGASGNAAGVWTAVECD